MKRYFVANSITGIKAWAIEYINGDTVVTFGRYKQTMSTKVISESRGHSESRINTMLSKGYIEVTLDEYLWGTFNLPTTNLDKDGNLKAMLCQKFKLGKFNYNALIQPKLNGLRAFIIWGTVTEGTGLFAKSNKQAVILSREGHRYVMPHIEAQFTENDFDIIDAYDGELYSHHLTLNEIRACVPMVNANGTISVPSGNPLLIQFHAFDIAADGLDQYDRNIMLHNRLPKKDNIIMVPTNIVQSDEEALNFANQFIRYGYEGAVIRDIHAEYAFGQRPRTMMKIKKFLDGEFDIVDIIPKPKEPYTALFVLRNDINNEIFECNPMGTYTQRVGYLQNRENIIGKYKATVKYYERSGVKQVPFHANVVTIRDYE